MTVSNYESDYTNFYSLAEIGFFAILFTFSINLSIGLKAKSLAIY